MRKLFIQTVLFGVAVLAGACSNGSEPADEPLAATKEDLTWGSNDWMKRPFIAYINGTYTPTGEANHCTGTFLSSRVVVTAGHCINEMSNLRVNAPNVNATWINAAQSFFHPHESFDIGVIILSSPANVSRFPSLHTTPTCSTTPSGLYGIGLDTGSTLNRNTYRFRSHMYGRVKNSALMPVPQLQSDSRAVCTENHLYYESDSQPGEAGDSGGPVFLVDSSSGREQLHSIMVAGVKYNWGANEGFAGNDYYTTVFMNVQWVAPWLQKIVQTNAPVNADSYTTVPNNVNPFRVPEQYPTSGDIYVANAWQIGYYKNRIQCGRRFDGSIVCRYRPVPFRFVRW